MRTFDGGMPVVAHPPCRMWGRYHYKALGSEREKELARLAVVHVRRWGGVLEHPSGSKLWADVGLPRPGAPPDVFGGRTLSVRQCDWGHRAIKSTWLYVCAPYLPPRPVAATGPFVPVEHMGRQERERTPPKFAEWLVAIARSA
ncbi:hypothetical protein [Roseovarius amoyensis]|uniref:hypothetical protein n=1 Tax=Roseovarius amoyensis TaxID=2211448 RepID=UPI0019551810|nr:hypothetical protein [Roseovarius amoyensis]